MQSVKLGFVSPGAENPMVVFPRTFRWVLMAAFPLSHIIFTVAIEAKLAILQGNLHGGGGAYTPAAMASKTTRHLLREV